MSISSFRPALALIPFGYLAVTRLKSVREIVFLVATSWLPAVWLIIRLAGMPPLPAIATFLLGYLAFIALYEIGYLINDLWDARRSDDGRTRFEERARWPYILAFVAIRLALWVLIGIQTGWISLPIWLLGHAVLAIALAQHNLSRSTALRLASFLELATLRFLLPIVAAIPRTALWPVMLIALILYAYPRFLAYMDSKGVLQLPERREGRFGVAQLLWLAPLLLFTAHATSSDIIAEMLAYFILIYGLGSTGFRRARGDGAV